MSFNGLLASLCYLLQWLVCLAGSWLTDTLRSRQLVSTLTIRKINTFLGLWVTGLCSVLAVYSGCQAELAVTLFALAAGLNLLTVPGCKSGFMDIAPDYSGLNTAQIICDPVIICCIFCRDLVFSGQHIWKYSRLFGP